MALVTTSCPGCGCGATGVERPLVSGVVGVGGIGDVDGEGPFDNEALLLLRHSFLILLTGFKVAPFARVSRDGAASFPWGSSESIENRLEGG